MLDYEMFWNIPEVAMAREELLVAARAFEVGKVEEPLLERAVLLHNEVVGRARERFERRPHEMGDEHGLTEVEREMVFGWHLADAKLAPPQTDELTESRTALLDAVRDIDKPLGKWEREFNLNMCSVRYAMASRWARRPLRKESVACRGTSPMLNRNTSISMTTAPG